MKFAVYQIQITDAEIDLINSTGDFNSVPKKKAQIDMEFDFGGDKIGGLAYDAMEAGYYTHVANIEAGSLNEVFQTGNIGPEQNIERLARMHSISVGDIIVDEEGQCNVVAPIGFVAFSFRPELAAMNVKPTPQIEDNSMDGTIVTEKLPRHGSPQHCGSADAYYGRRYYPHYYVGDTMRSERVEKDDMTVEELAAYKYGYDNEDDRKEW